MIDLFLLPFAGGTSLTYKDWFFSSSVNAIALDYRGHGFRMKTPLYESFEEMVEDIADQIKQKMSSAEISIFGHSMGGLVAWDVADRLTGEGVQIRNIIISACLPPHLFNEHKYGEMATDEWLMNFLTRYGRIKPDKMESRFFKTCLYPAIRNDYRMISLHRHEKIKVHSFDIACFFGMQDELMPSLGMEQWKEYTDGKFLLKGFRGEHFYIEDEVNRKGIVAAVESFITE